MASSVSTIFIRVIETAAECWPHDLDCEKAFQRGALRVAQHEEAWKQSRSTRWHDITTVEPSWRWRRRSNGKQ